MTFELPRLNYSLDGLDPAISVETMQFHFNRHHQGYVDKLNELIKDTQFEQVDLAHIVKHATGPIYNNAAQHWNHSFFWHSLNPKKSPPRPELLYLIKKNFNSLADFEEKFKQVANAHFGSGWIWLIKNYDEKLEIISTQDAGCPIRYNLTPLMVLDLWEHAYYIDYRNKREEYIDAFMQMINWDFVWINLHHT